MAEKSRRIIVDTYAIMADLTGQAIPRAVKVLDSLRMREMEGILYYLIVYELAYHWRKGRLPFRDEDELEEFITTYFRVINLTPRNSYQSSPSQGTLRKDLKRN